MEFDIFKIAADGNSGALDWITTPSPINLPEPEPLQTTSLGMTGLDLIDKTFKPDQKISGLDITPVESASRLRRGIEKFGPIETWKPDLIQALHADIYTVTSAWRMIDSSWEQSDAAKSRRDISLSGYRELGDSLLQKGGIYDADPNWIGNNLVQQTIADPQDSLYINSDEFDPMLKQQLKLKLYEDRYKKTAVSTIYTDLPLIGRVGANVSNIKTMGHQTRHLAQIPNFLAIGAQLFDIGKTKSAEARYNAGKATDDDLRFLAKQRVLPLAEERKNMFQKFADGVAESASILIGFGIGKKLAGKGAGILLSSLYATPFQTSTIRDFRGKMTPEIGEDGKLVDHGIAKPLFESLLSTFISTAIEGLGAKFDTMLGAVGTRAAGVLNKSRVGQAITDSFETILNKTSKVGVHSFASEGLEERAQELTQGTISAITPLDLGDFGSIGLLAEGEYAKFVDQMIVETMVIGALQAGAAIVGDDAARERAGQFVLKNPTLMPAHTMALAKTKGSKQDFEKAGITGTNRKDREQFMQTARSMADRQTLVTALNSPVARMEIKDFMEGKGDFKTVFGREEGYHGEAAAIRRLMNIPANRLKLRQHFDSTAEPMRLMKMRQARAWMKSYKEPFFTESQITDAINRLNNGHSAKPEVIDAILVPDKIELLTNSALMEVAFQRGVLPSADMYTTASDLLPPPSTKELSQMDKKSLAEMVERRFGGEVRIANPLKVSKKELISAINASYQHQFLRARGDSLAQHFQLGATQEVAELAESTGATITEVEQVVDMMGELYRQEYDEVDRTIREALNRHLGSPQKTGAILRKIQNDDVDVDSIGVSLDEFYENYMGENPPMRFGSADEMFQFLKTMGPSKQRIGRYDPEIMRRVREYLERPAPETTGEDARLDEQWEPDPQPAPGPSPAPQPQGPASPETIRVKRPVIRTGNANDAWTDLFGMSIEQIQAYGYDGVEKLIRETLTPFSVEQLREAAKQRFRINKSDSKSSVINRAVRAIAERLESYQRTDFGGKRPQVSFESRASGSPRDGAVRIQPGTFGMSQIPVFYGQVYDAASDTWETVATGETEQEAADQLREITGQGDAPLADLGEVYGVLYTPDGRRVYGKDAIELSPSTATTPDGRTVASLPPDLVYQLATAMQVPLVAADSEFKGEYLPKPSLKRRKKKPYNALDESQNPDGPWAEVSRDILRSPEQYKTALHELSHGIDLVDFDASYNHHLLAKLQNFFVENKAFWDENRSKLSADVTDEVERVSKIMRTWVKTNDEYSAYRSRPEELYADFVAMVLGDPATAKRVAPNAWTMFFSFLDKKPLVAKNYWQIQETLTDLDGLYQVSENLQEQASQNTKFENERLQEIVEKTADNIYGRNRIWPWIKKVFAKRQAYAEKGMSLTEQEMLIEQMTPKKLEVAYADEVDRQVLRPLQAAGLTVRQVSHYLMLDSIAAGQREGEIDVLDPFDGTVKKAKKELLNPYGLDRNTAQQRLDGMSRVIGEKKFAALKQAADNFRQLNYQQMMHIKEMNPDFFSPDGWKMIEENKDFYSRFASTKHSLDAYQGLPTQLIAAIGSLDATENHLGSTMLQTQAMLRGASLDAARSTVLMHVMSKHPDHVFQKHYHNGKWVYSSKKPPNRKGFGVREVGKPDMPDHFYAEIAVKDQGKLRRYVIPKLMVDALEGDVTSFSDLGPIQKILAFTAKMPGRIYTRLNISFMLPNWIRDAISTLERLPALSRAKKMFGDTNAGEPIGHRDLIATILSIPFDKELRQSIYAASGATESQLLNEMRQFGAVPATSLYHGGTMTQEMRNELPDAFEVLTRMQNKSDWKILNAVSKILDIYQLPTEVFWKAVSYRTARKKGWSEKAAGRLVRKGAGTPDTSQRGTLAKWASLFSPFYNVNMQGNIEHAKILAGTYGKDATLRGWRDAMLFSSPRLIWTIAKYALMYAAGQEGYEWAKDALAWMNDQDDSYSEYEKRTAYLPVVMGQSFDTDGNKKVGRYTIPAGYLEESVFTLLAGIENLGNGEYGDALLDIADAIGAPVPSSSHPAFDLALGLKATLSGKTHLDSFTNRPIVDPDVIRYGDGADKAWAFGEYAVDKLGFTKDLIWFGNFFAGNIETKEDWANAPIVRRFYKYNDWPDRERMYQEMQRADAEIYEVDQQFMQGDPSVARQTYNTLANKVESGHADERQTMWSMIFGRLNRAVISELKTEHRELLKTGEKETAKRLYDFTQKASNDFLQAYSKNDTGGIIRAYPQLFSGSLNTVLQSTKKTDSQVSEEPIIQLLKRSGITLDEAKQMIDLVPDQSMKVRGRRKMRLDRVW